MSLVDFAPLESQAGADKPRREFLTCVLGGESYGIDLLKVQEIREVDLVTRVPRVAPFVRGVINLRGAIVPIVDLGMLFGFTEPLPLAKSSAIILNCGRRLTGLVVEGVSDVVGLAEDEIEPAPELGGRSIAAAIEGIGTRRDVAEGERASSVLLLDVEYVVRRLREERA
jgi:purine-binding chemotaxis protein CheW